MDTKGIAVIGSLPSGLPSVEAPILALNELAALTIPAAGIAIAARNGQEIDANAEMRALGCPTLAPG